MPDNIYLGFRDLLRGRVDISSINMDDLTIIEANGKPSEIFATVIDDIEMKVSHVIRGAEYLQNTPSELLLYRYLRLTPPQFVHISATIDDPGTYQLSCPTGISDYRKLGIFPEAIARFLILAGHSGSNKFNTVENAIENFRLEDISVEPVSLSESLLMKINRSCIRSKTDEEIYSETIPLMRDRIPFANASTTRILKRSIPLFKNRISALVEIVDSAYLFTDEFEYDQQALLQYFNQGIVQYIQSLKVGLDQIPEESWNHTPIEQAVRTAAVERDIKYPLVTRAVRLALSGQCEGLGIFELAELLGKETTIRRLENVTEMLKCVVD
jgi:glutamyl/glutaminyl-tRNA synthetase